MADPFHVTVCSNSDYEELIAEIYFRDVYFGLVNEEAGPGQLVLEIDPSARPMILPLGDFGAALEHAKRRLRELRKSTS